MVVPLLAVLKMRLAPYGWGLVKKKPHPKIITKENLFIFT